MPTLCTTGEVFVWFLELVLVAWGGGNALQAYVARRSGGSDAVRTDYEAEARPSWAPPPWIFGVVWPLLYIALAIVGTRLRLLGAWGDSDATAPLVLLALLLFTLLCWPAIYAGARLKRLGIAVHSLALALAIVLCVVAWSRDTAAGALVVPLCVWLAYALALAVAIERLRANASAPAPAPAPHAAPLQAQFAAPNGGTRFGPPSRQPTPQPRQRAPQQQQPQQQQHQYQQHGSAPAHTPGAYDHIELDVVGSFA